MTKKSTNIQPESHLLSLTNINKANAQSLFKADTIELTALYYSAPLNEKLLSRNCTSSSTIEYNTKTLNENIIELPNISKHLIIEDPSLRNNDIFYINPLPDLKIIGDPTLPDQSKIKDCPNGKFRYIGYIILI